jgi:hypothetical protein
MNCQKFKSNYRFGTTPFAFLLILLLSISACRDNDSNKDMLDHIEFKALVLGTDERARLSFPSGKDVHMSLELINNSGEEIAWQYDYCCELVQQEGFFRLYKKNDMNETVATYSFLGSPYQRPINCLALNIPARKIPVGKSIVINIPWSNNPDNKTLSPGEYYLASDFTFNSKAWQLRFDFEIE